MQGLPGRTLKISNSGVVFGRQFSRYSAGIDWYRGSIPTWFLPAPRPNPRPERDAGQSIRTPPIRNGLRHCSLWLPFHFPDSSNAISTNGFTGEPDQATRFAAKSISCAAKISPVTTSAATAAPVRPSIACSTTTRNSSFLVVFSLGSAPAGKAKRSKARAHVFEHFQVVSLLQYGLFLSPPPLFENHSPCPPRQLTGRRHFTIASLSGSRAGGTVNKTRRKQAVSSQSFNRTRFG
jgi:hypothetical protein